MTLSILTGQRPTEETIAEIAEAAKGLKASKALADVKIVRPEGWSPGPHMAKTMFLLVPRVDSTTGEVRLEKVRSISPGKMSKILNENVNYEWEE
jgi:hypothetical protein